MKFRDIFLCLELPDLHDHVTSKETSSIQTVQYLNNMAVVVGFPLRMFLSRFQLILKCEAEHLGLWTHFSVPLLGLWPHSAHCPDQSHQLGSMPLPSEGFFQLLQIRINNTPMVPQVNNKTFAAWICGKVDDKYALLGRPCDFVLFDLLYWFLYIISEDAMEERSLIWPLNQLFTVY